MKILMIFHASPCPPELGPARRHYHLLRELLKRHEVSVLSFGTTSQREAFAREFGDSCRQVRFVQNRLPFLIDALVRLTSTLAGRSTLRHGYTRRLQRELETLTLTERFDLIICSIPFLGHYRFPAGIPVISDTHKIGRAHV